MPLLASIDERRVFDLFLQRGAIDGRTVRADQTVDGHDIETAEQILAALREAIRER